MYLCVYEIIIINMVFNSLDEGENLWYYILWLGVVCICWFLCLIECGCDLYGDIDIELVCRFCFVFVYLD